MSNTHKRIAKITSTMLGFEDHGFFTAIVNVEYGGSAQGVGCMLLSQRDATTDRHVPTRASGLFIAGVLRACGVSCWEQLKGRTIFVLLDSDNFQAKPIGLAPLPTEDGEAFMFTELEAS